MFLTSQDDNQLEILLIIKVMTTQMVATVAGVLTVHHLLPFLIFGAPTYETFLSSI